jgi:hypothetical protein
MIRFSGPYRNVQTEDRILPVFNRVLEERIADQFLLVVDVLFFTVRDDHVVEALKRIARNLRSLPDDLQVVFEGTFPGQILVAFVVLQGSYLLDHFPHREVLLINQSTINQDPC